RHQRAVGQGADLRRVQRVHDDRRRHHGAALRLPHPEFRLQPDDLVPGGDHGAARRHAAAVGTGARRPSADRAVGAAAGAVSVLVQRAARPRVHGDRLFSSARHYRLDRGWLESVATARHRRPHLTAAGEALATTAGRRAMMAALLEVYALTKAFGGLVAVSNMSLAVSSGEVLGLIGPNGSGKTTLLNLIAGAIGADAGTIRIDGEDVTGLSNHMRVRKRINRTFQLVRMPPNLPAIVGVMAGVMYGAEPKRYKDAESEAAGILGELNLLLKAGHRLDQLTYIEQKRVELARALATRPHVLLLDEWLSGLSPGELEGGMSVV